MKKLITMITLAGGAILASPSVFAQFAFVSNDLYFGFQNQAGSGSADYIINLGPASGIIGGSAVVDLSSDFSLTDFTSAALQGTAPDVLGGVVAGSNAFTAPDFYATQLRVGGGGAPSVPGSASPTDVYKGDILNLYDAAAGMTTLPTAGNGLLDTSKGWETYVEPDTTGNSVEVAGVNPDNAAATGKVLYEDLWYVSNDSTKVKIPWTYEGYFTLDLSGSIAKLTFSPVGAPAALAPIQTVSIGYSAGTVTVVSSGAVAPHSYQLQYTTSLSSPNWINVGSPQVGAVQVAASAMVTNLDTTATGGQRFYRVVGN